VATLTEEGGGGGVLIPTPAMGDAVQSLTWTRGLEEEKSVMV
jgi:hypothetical protein